MQYVLARFDCFHLDYSYTNVTYVPSKNVAIFIFIIVVSHVPCSILGHYKLVIIILFIHVVSYS